MRITLPKNIFSALFALALPEEMKKNITIESSSLINKSISENKTDIGLIPSMDLIDLNDFYISKKIGLSFSGVLSNSYLYFVPDRINFRKLLIRGDISKNEALLPKIIFKERFGIEIQIVLDNKDINFNENNYLITGSENQDYIFTNKGISFSDQVIEFLEYPYVNFIFASKNKILLEEFNSAVEHVEETMTNNLDEYLQKINLPANLKDYYKENFDTVLFHLSEEEIEGLLEMTKLPFYYGIVKELKEINFI